MSNTLYRSLIGFSAVARMVNAKWFIKTCHRRRQWFVGLGMAFGFLLISFCVFGTGNGIKPSQEYKFYLSLVASIIIGVTCSVGESNILGLLKGFPSHMIGFFGSGTGFAGILGTSTLLILHALHLTDAEIYLTATPTMIPYIYCCMWLIDQQHKHVYIPEVILHESQEDLPTNSESPIISVEKQANSDMGVIQTN